MSTPGTSPSGAFGLPRNLCSLHPVTSRASHLPPPPLSVSQRIKKEMDSRSGGGSWHCIVGQDFGSYVTHEAKHFIYFYVNKLGVLLFKSG